MKIKFVSVVRRIMF